MRSCQPTLFHKRQFTAEIIVTCVRWYLHFSLSLRDVEELMAERGLSVDHTGVWRWTFRRPIPYVSMSIQLSSSLPPMSR
jgi:transposase-like protein